MCVCVYVCPIWCSGMCSRFPIERLRVPDDYGHTRLSSLSRTLPDFSFILLGGYQQPVYAGVCGVVCVKKYNIKIIKN